MRSVSTAAQKRYRHPLHCVDSAVVLLSRIRGLPLSHSLFNSFTLCLFSLHPLVVSFCFYLFHFTSREKTKRRKERKTVLPFISNSGHTITFILPFPAPSFPLNNDYGNFQRNAMPSKVVIKRNETDTLII